MTEPSNTRTIGAAPVGARDQAAAAQAVREMFTSIAPRYDLLNHVLSFNIDRVWWWRTARAFDSILQRPNARVLDLCCGTGDMTFALGRRANSASVQIIGADFSHAMLQRAAVKGRGTRLRWMEADACFAPEESAASWISASHEDGLGRSTASISKRYCRPWER